MYNSIDEMVQDALDILDAGKSFRLLWTCRGCKQICLTNVPNAIFIGGLLHEECQTVTPTTEASIVEEPNPVVIPRYEDLPVEVLEKLLGDEQ